MTDTRGMLDLSQTPSNLVRCCAPDCGWEGVPTFINGVASTRCPSCEHEDDSIIERELDAESMPKVGRNEPCPCGSGKKFKRCHAR